MTPGGVGAPGPGVCVCACADFSIFDLDGFLRGSQAILDVLASNRSEIWSVRNNSASSETFQRRVGPLLAYVSG